MKKKKILVTGGSGFLGSALVKKLSSEGNDVYVFDNEFRGSKNRIKGINISKYIIGDIRNKKDLEKIKIKFDYIFHLAFINGTNFFYEKPKLVLDVGIKGILNILECIKFNKQSKFILASSSEVYNYPKKIPTDEKTEIIIPDISNPRFSYSAGKIISEIVTINYLKEKKIPYLIFRPHNIFGPNMGNNHVIPEIIKKIYTASSKFYKKSCKIFIQGSGKETRSFCFVNDAINQLNFIYEKRGSDNQIFNIGQKNEITIIKLIQDISKILNIKVKIISKPLLKGSVKRRCPNISKLLKIGYKNNNNYSPGLRQTVLWYKKILTK